MTTAHDTPQTAQDATPLAVCLNAGLGVGSRIRFVRTLTQPPSGDHPTLLYAYAGEMGTIVGHDCMEGYQVKTDNWHQWFGAHRDEFEPAPNV